jgi:hypothetical protein
MGEQNNNETKKLRNRIYISYIENTSFGSADCSSIRLHSVVQVH